MRSSRLFNYVVLMILIFNMNAYSQRVTKWRVLPPECMGVELDGSQTLRSYGTGRNKSDAIEQAKKNAVYAVLFTGINSGSSECEMRPLLGGSNAREKYAKYFDAFFKDGGEYSHYISSDDEKTGSKSHKKTKTFVNYAVTVRVLRTALKEKLIADNILNIEL